MPIINVYPNDPGHAGDIPAIQRLETNDTIAMITATGYLNHAVQSGLISVSETDAMLVATSVVAGHSPTQVGWYEVSHSGSNWSLVPTASPGSVTLPTIANHLAVFTNTTGNLGEDATTAINGGNIQAGLSGTSGTLASFPSASSKGSLKLVGVANTGNTDVSISNVAHGQASVYSIPDCGGAVGRFLNANTATPFTTGHLIASSGTGGLTADSGIATASVATFTGATVVGNIVKASTTGGQIADAGFALKANTTAAYAGGGTSNAFTATGLTSSSIVTAVILASTNAVSIAKAVPSSNTLTVTFSADPGANTTVSWIAITPAV